MGNDYKIDTKYGGPVHISFPLFHRVLHMVIPFPYANIVTYIISQIPIISKCFQLVPTVCRSFYPRTVSFLRTAKDNGDGFLSHHGIVSPPPTAVDETENCPLVPSSMQHFTQTAPPPKTTRSSLFSARTDGLQIFLSPHGIVFAYRQGQRGRFSVSSRHCKSTANRG